MAERSKFNTLRNNDYATLGRRVVAEYPSVAAKLLENPTVPKQTNLNLIPGYYEILSLPGTKKERLRQDKVFICVMLHLYQPVVFNQALEDIYIRKGLLKSFATLLNYKQPSTAAGRIIREVITSYKIYDDFKEQVDAALKEVDNG